MFDPDLPASGQPLFKPACGKCGEQAELVLLCSRCKSLTYCSKECQLEDFKVHKKSCKNIKDLKDAMNTGLQMLGVKDLNDFGEEVPVS